LILAWYRYNEYVVNIGGKMDRAYIKKLHEFYRANLFEDCIPFWLKNSIDRKHGGYLTCLDGEGKIYNTDKSVWFQGRGTWIYSRLYNTVEKKQEWLETSKSGYNFLVNHCFDSDGRMFFQVTEDGRPLRKRRYMYSEAFAVIACAEYSRASGNTEALKKARETYDLILHIYKNPIDANPKVFQETRVTNSLAVPMILLATTQSLREIDNNPVYDEITSELTEIIFNNFFKPKEKALFETVGANGERLDSPQGRCINPGHSIETA
jgi:N-acylglucosamine 2-epimerase